MKQKSKADVAPAQSGQHTPGPWKLRVMLHNQFSRDERGEMKPIATIEGNVDSDDCGDTIASLTTRFYNGGESTPRSLEGEWQANARLIAAAPDLLEALRRIYNNANARVWNCEEGAGHPDFDAFYSMAREARAAIAKAERGQA